jgi:hypothetical protein
MGTNVICYNRVFFGEAFCFRPPTAAAPVICFSWIDFSPVHDPVDYNSP